eukprot:TRINITY_DN37290_c0_g1_i1.p1 TRINITY_DN37290_c0_g1~~TRINITY_DN37290_c0_g1_i1.p1  ORF type:complete len:152 (-),score=13.81 TRINITY_DN37290_c0_g1_i1:14-469(-)
MADFIARFGMDDSSECDHEQFPLNWSDVDLTFDDKEEDRSQLRSSLVSRLKEKITTMRYTERRAVTERAPPSVSSPASTTLSGVVPSQSFSQTSPVVIVEPAQPRARAVSVLSHRRTKRVGMVVFDGESSRIVTAPSDSNRSRSSVRSRRR